MATQKEYEVLLSLNYNDNGIVEIQATQAKLVKEQIKAFKTMGDAVSEVYQDSVEQTEAYNDAIKDNLSQLKAQDLQIKKRQRLRKSTTAHLTKSPILLETSKPRHKTESRGFRDLFLDFPNQRKVHRDL